MEKLCIFLSMVFLHIIDDYCLQACTLSSLKQKKWWKKNAPKRMYRFDYIAALLAHAFSWAFMIMLPISVARYETLSPIEYGCLFCFNLFLHAFIDDQKANRGNINLIVDQLLHMCQLVVTWLGLVA